jgi:hypothetical protein
LSRNQEIYDALSSLVRKYRPDSEPFVREDFPPLVGVSEASDILGVQRQRGRQLLKHPDFPGPVAQLKCGPVYLRDEVIAYHDVRNKRVGRPRKGLEAAVEQLAA